MKVCSYLLSLSFALSLIILSHPAQATLGESSASVAKDRKAMAAVRQNTTPRPSYTVQEIVSEANTVREYVSPSGVVFAIAWNGLTPPDLSLLLGTYADDYRQARQQSLPKPGQRHSQVKGNQVVVESWGHMRNLQGRAYVPALLPQGVNIDEIK